MIRRVDAHDQIAALKAKAGRDIFIFGSHILWNDLLAKGLVDELHLMIGPGVVGDGVRAFETGPKGPLRLIKARKFDGSNLFLTQYAVGH